MLWITNHILCLSASAGPKKLKRPISVCSQSSDISNESFNVTVFLVSLSVPCCRIICINILCQDFEKDKWRRGRERGENGEKGEREEREGRGERGRRGRDKSGGGRGRSGEREDKQADEPHREDRNEEMPCAILHGCWRHCPGGPWERRALSLAAIARALSSPCYEKDGDTSLVQGTMLPLSAPLPHHPHGYAETNSQGQVPGWCIVGRTGCPRKEAQCG